MKALPYANYRRRRDDRLAEADESRRVQLIKAAEIARFEVDLRRPRHFEFVIDPIAQTERVLAAAEKAFITLDSLAKAAPRRRSLSQRFFDFLGC